MNRVKELCMRAGISQKQVAINVGVSQPSVSDWFNGRNNPSGERLDKLADLLGVSRAVILGYDPMPGEVAQKGSSSAEQDAPYEIHILLRDNMSMSLERLKRREALMRMLWEMDDDELDTAEQLINIVNRKKTERGER